MSSCSGSTFLKGIEKCPQCSPSRLMKAKMRSMSTKVSSSTFGCRTDVCMYTSRHRRCMHRCIYPYTRHKGLLLHIRVPYLDRYLGRLPVGIHVRIMYIKHIRTFTATSVACPLAAKSPLSTARCT